jgi:hypothetical protein
MVMTLLRRAGSGRLTDGSRLVWTVAEGSRGRRWRWTHTTNAGLCAVGLLELDEDGDFARLELGSPVGLLTLHVDDAGGEVHGNVAGPDGMRHLRLPWSRDDSLLVEGEPLVAAAMCHRLAGRIDPRPAHEHGVILVEPSFVVRDTRGAFVRDSETRWRIELSQARRFRIAIDGQGLPTGLADEASWPLEIDQVP